MTLTLVTDFWTAQDGKSRARKCGLLLLTATILAFLLPYDSNGELDFVLGASEWFGHVLMLMVTTGVTGRWLFPKMKDAHPALVLLPYTAINALPVLFISMLLDYLLVSFEAPFNYSLDVYLGWVTESFLLTLLVIGVLSLVAVKFEFAGPNIKAASEPRPGQKFFNRLSTGANTDLMCLEMEDHYLRVHTSEGNQLLHMRMADAVSELEGFPGFQVHRSWWIAAEAIKTISKQNRDYKATLKNGMTVPISRSRVDALKDRGFI